MFMHIESPVPDPDLEIKGGEEGGEGGGAEERGGPVSKKMIFLPFGHQFGLKIRGAGPPGPFPGSATEVYYTKRSKPFNR